MSPVNEFTAEGLPTYFLKNIPTESAVPGLTLGAAAHLLRPGSRSARPACRGAHAPAKAPTSPSGQEAATRTRKTRTTAKAACPYRWRSSPSPAVPRPTLLQPCMSPDLFLLFGATGADRVARGAPSAPGRRPAVPGRRRWPRRPGCKDCRRLRAPTCMLPSPTCATPTGAPLRFNYIRNAVKATVDAYDGTVTLYAADERDSILRTYRRIFPGLVKPLDQMPAEPSARTCVTLKTFRRPAPHLRGLSRHGPGRLYPAPTRGRSRASAATWRGAAPPSCRARKGRPCPRIT